MTRRGGNIGLWILHLFSMSIATAQTSKPTSDSLASVAHPISSRWEEMIFPNLIWDNRTALGAETFCIFRNSAFGASGLHQVALAHRSKDWRLDYQNKGSDEWSSQMGLLHYSLALNQKNKISLGLGCAWEAGNGVLQQQQTGPLNSPNNPANALIQGGYVVEIPRSGRFILTVRGILSADLLRSALPELKPKKPLNAVAATQQYLWNESNVLWIGKEKKQSKPWLYLQPFAGITQSPQITFIEAGLNVIHTKNWSFMAALNTTNKPIRLGIIKYNNKWRMGMEVQWQGQLGWLGALQLRYRWR